MRKNKKVTQEDFAEHRIEIRLLVADQILQQEKARISLFEKLEKKIKRLECNHPKLRFEAWPQGCGDPEIYTISCALCGIQILTTTCKPEWLIAKQRYLKEASEAELEKLDREINASGPCDNNA